MSAFDTTWALLKMPITYEQQPNWFEQMQKNPRYLYSGGHRDDEFRYFTDNPNVALGIGLFGSAVPRKWFPDDESRKFGSRNPLMRETVPQIKRIDTSMVDEDIELFGQPYEAILPSPEISRRLEQMGALTDIPQSRLKENLKEIIDSERFHKARYKMFRDTGIDDWGEESFDFENDKRFMREQIPFSMGWWEFEENHPVFERLGFEWDLNRLNNEMWFPDISNTSAGYSGNPYSRKDLLNHVKGALNRLQTGVPGVVEIPKDQRKFYGIAENDDRPIQENILARWKNDGI